MSKRNYKITPQEFSFGMSFKVEAWDDYGKYTCVYERNLFNASEFIVDFWEKSEENKEKDELTHKAMLNMIEIDKKCNICKGNRDGLD